MARREIKYNQYGYEIPSNPAYNEAIHNPKNQKPFPLDHLSTTPIVPNAPPYTSPRGKADRAKQNWEWQMRDAMAKKNQQQNMHLLISKTATPTNMNKKPWHRQWKDQQYQQQHPQIDQDVNVFSKPVEKMVLNGELKIDEEEKEEETMLAPLNFVLKEKNVVLFSEVNEKKKGYPLKPYVDYVKDVISSASNPFKVDYGDFMIKFVDIDHIPVCSLFSLSLFTLFSMFLVF